MRKCVWALEPHGCFSLLPETYERIYHEIRRLESGGRGGDDADLSIDVQPDRSFAYEENPDSYFLRSRELTPLRYALLLQIPRGGWSTSIPSGLC